MLIEDLIEAFGGRAIAASLPSVIAPEVLHDLDILCKGAINLYQFRYRSCGVQPVDIVITCSGSMLFQVHPPPTSDGHFTIFFPLGYYIRLRILFRLLLKFWGKDSAMTPYLVSSPEDDVPFEIPRSLLAVFGEFIDDVQFWDAAKKLSDEAYAAEAFRQDIEWMTNLGILFMLYHELGHIALHHFEYLKTDVLLERSGLGPSEFRKAIEIEADEEASFSTLLHLLSDLHRAVPASDTSSYANSLQRLSYAVTASFGLFDPNKKAFSLYHNLGYLHPMIRHIVFVESATSAFARLKPEMVPLWQEAEVSGWAACMSAFNDLSFEFMCKGETMGPLPCLTYGVGAAAEEITRLRDEAASLKLKLRDALP